MKRIIDTVIHVTDKDIFDLVRAKYPDLVGAALTIMSVSKPPEDAVGPKTDWGVVTIARTVEES
jgi:hypothetical protein